MKFKVNENMTTKHLNAKQKKIAQTILEGAATIMGSDYEISGGGCKAFHTPQEWQAREEEYGLQSELIIVHDGGDLAPCFNYDYMSYEHREAVNVKLESAGYYAEQCTSWYTAIYPI